LCFYLFSYYHFYFFCYCCVSSVRLRLQLLSFVEPSSGRVDALYFDQALVQVASLLRRYLAEYDFRYNHRVKLGYNDGERAARAVKNATGKRLTLRGPT
jgi:hypothetical protein